MGLLDYTLTIMLDSDKLPSIDQAAKRDGRSRSSYIRNLINLDLKSKGLLDENLEPIEVQSEAAE